MSKLIDDTVDRDLQQGAVYIQRQGQPATKIGVVGFCMGGSIALRQSVDGAATYKAVSVFYGKVRYSAGGTNDGPIVPIDVGYAGAMAVPVAGSWGGRDTSILPDDVRALEARLTDLNKPHDFALYDEAGHAFFDDTRSSYVASAANDAWLRTISWFRRFLS